jgi:hypothetical protein
MSLRVFISKVSNKPIADRQSPESDFFVQTVQFLYTHLAFLGRKKGNLKAKKIDRSPFQGPVKIFVRAGALFPYHIDN